MTDTPKRFTVKDIARYFRDSILDVALTSLEAITKGTEQ